jgi:hypothetical protein
VHLRHLVGGRARGSNGHLANERIMQVSSGTAVVPQQYHASASKKSQPFAAVVRLP